MRQSRKWDGGNCTEIMRVVRGYLENRVMKALWELSF